MFQFQASKTDSGIRKFIKKEDYFWKNVKLKQIA
ncbi:Uncharacterised protein [Streptococcus porcinus]|uniref:Uncharacterized protein n=1 Tax=Streptococcus porcinus TaxID=1340 RepID=A0A4V0HC79_STRPO|nr:Uncharacterised protein [Streptococcus porcinus]VTT47120.1 Uncharacterised protein [Streptococcus porcinus]VTT48139.1 Uncharacterised protein [Streptococcus porcinus]